MRTMKKWLTMLSVVVLAAVTVLAVGCGAKGEEFKFSHVEVTSNDSTMETTMKTAFETLYKDYTWVVSGSEFILKNKSSESKMQYEMDGEKYILIGEEVDKIKKTMIDVVSGASEGIMDMKVDAKLYAEKTNDGWVFVTEESITISMPGLPTIPGMPGISPENVECTMRVIFKK